MSDLPHIIRLRRAWQIHPLPHGSELRRRFHRPTGLGGGERVWLVVEDASHAGHVACNHCRLGPLVEGQAAEFEITDLLTQSNEIRIEVAHHAEAKPAGEPFGEVRLEIRPPA